MLRKILSLVAIVALVFPISATAQTWTVDSVHSAVAFKVRHFFSKVQGNFRDFSGTIEFDPAKPEAMKIDFEIKAASIDTANDGRDKHLRNEDFFDVEKYPLMTFKSTSVKSVGEGKMKVTGQMKIKNKTKVMTIDVDFHGAANTPRGKKAGFSTSFTIDRTEFDVTYNGPMEGGGTMLGNDVEIDLEIQVNG